MKTNIIIKAFIIFLFAFTACNINQQRKDAIDSRNKSDSIMNEFNKINQRLEQENLKMKEDMLEYDKKRDSLHHLLDSLNSQSK
ncbi:hypothetical protein [Chitinophaga tropicalis]|uniref:Uncharacterized protein n=1 Tax=Chitinophaga tropicalis TaxID=2683588 RepID=A0A7K1U505_9BACT|nr:hypothetical protein [Chitinophaga tropicalis]MVT09443.1 hypothetical protein [Chitinophaga tropicalis]